MNFIIFFFVIEEMNRVIFDLVAVIALARTEMVWNFFKLPLRQRWPQFPVLSATLGVFIALFLIVFQMRSKQCYDWWLAYQIALDKRKAVLIASLAYLIWKPQICGFWSPDGTRWARNTAINAKPFWFPLQFQFRVSNCALQLRREAETNVWYPLLETGR